MDLKYEEIKEEDGKMCYNVHFRGIETSRVYSTYDKKQAQFVRDSCQGIIDYYESVIRNKQR